jgi:hypothetical protein
MLGLPLVHALEDDWRETLDAVARRHGWPSTTDVARLAAQVADLSRAYNDPARARATMREAGAARLGFSFARDVPKTAAAVRELVATGRLKLGPPGPELLRVLDLGAGLGAGTWGVVRALGAAGGRGTVEATWVDADAEALALGREIVEARLGRDAEPRITLRVRCVRGGVDHRLEPLLGAASPPAGASRFDLVVAANVLSELAVDDDPGERVERHADLVGSWLQHVVDEHGALVVVEPALRDRTRHLHRLRDALALRPGVTIYAPCLHAAGCPALEREGDWCHEDLPVDLPPWLVPVARAAGLRREGLTFSYLVLRKDGARLADAIQTGPGGARLRLVSAPLPSKGKREAFLCGELRRAGALVPGRARVMRLDRDARESNAAWDRACRGDLLAVRPPPELERARIGAETTVDLEGDAANAANAPNVADAPDAPDAPGAVAAGNSAIRGRFPNESR